MEAKGQLFGVDLVEQAELRNPGSDIRAVMKPVLEKALGVLNALDQPTVAQCEERLPGGRDIKCAGVGGYPLPEVVMKQRDFLRIDERREELAKLRAVGDLEALAGYEADCFRAIFSALMGYKPMIFDLERRGAIADNKSIDDLLVTGSRGCGGMAIQAAFWLKQLGLNAFMQSALENASGAEGHISFLVKDSLGRLFFFDPAARVNYSPVPEGFYENQEEIPEQMGTLERGEVRHLRVNVSDREKAYKVGVSLRTVLGNLDDGIMDTLLIWVLSGEDFSDEEKLEIFKIFEVEGDIDSVPLYARIIRMEIAKKLGKEGEVMNSVLTLLDANFSGLETLKFVQMHLVMNGQVEMGWQVFMVFSSRIMEVISDSWPANYEVYKEIIHSGEAEGLYYRMRSMAGILDLFETYFQQFCFTAYYLKPFREQHMAYSDKMSGHLKEMFDLYLKILGQLDRMLRTLKLSEKIDLTQKSGAIVLAYARAQEFFKD